MKKLTLNIAIVFVAFASLLINSQEIKADTGFGIRHEAQLGLEEYKPVREYLFEVRIYHPVTGEIYQTKKVNSHSEAEQVRETFQNQWWKIWEISYENETQYKLFNSYEEAENFKPKGKTIKKEVRRAHADIKSLY